MTNIPADLQPILPTHLWSAECLHLPAMEAAARERPFHALVLQLSPPVNLEKRIGKRQKMHRTSPGEWSLLPSGILESGRWDVPVDLFVLHFTAALLADFCPQTSGNEEPFRTEIGASDPIVRHLISALCADHQMGNIGGRLFQESLITALCLRLLKCCGTRTGSDKNTAANCRREMEIIRDYIAAHLADDLSLTTLAGLVHISPSHFCTLFRQSVGVTPHQYLTQERVQAAKRLLKRGDTPIADVARRVGFSDQSHLTRHMRRVLGVTPHTLLPKNLLKTP